MHVFDMGHDVPRHGMAEPPGHGSLHRAMSPFSTPPCEGEQEKTSAIT